MGLITVTAEASARANLVGNPSDLYGGAVLAVPVPSLTALVSLEPAEGVEVVGPAGEHRWADSTALVAHTSRYGHEGGQRLVTAAIARFDAMCPTGGFRLRWSTTVPRSVGLAGSSALVLATLHALSRWNGLEPGAAEMASMALAAETEELEIGAGLADRAVQVAGRPVLLDLAGPAPAVSVLEPGAPTPCYVAWRPDAAAPSQRYHAALRDRFDRGDRAVVGAMGRLSALARDGAEALRAGDLDTLGAAIDGSYNVRAAVAPIGPTQDDLVGLARSFGLSASSAGSGGSVTGLAHDEDRWEALARAVRALGGDARRWVL